jgi:hypothetical protein
MVVVVEYEVACAGSRLGAGLLTLCSTIYALALFLLVYHVLSRTRWRSG